MASNTYVALDSKTIANNTTTYVDFTSIPQTYTDLVLVCNVTSFGGGGNYIYAQFGNGSIDTGSNYSTTIMSGNGATAVSTRFTNRTNFNIDYTATPSTTEPSVRILQIMNYSNTTTYKTGLLRASRGNGGADATVGTWRNTSAINTLRITTDQNFFAAGSTFSLYGIKAWAPETTPKATGGYVYSDSTYWYHAFPFSSTFTPNQSLTADILVVAGGGGGGSFTGGNGNGGGGAGGLLTYSSQSLTATSYTCTIGAGGAGGLTASNSTNGANSQFGALTSSVGGGRGANGGSASNASAVGGSGGGGQGSNDLGFVNGSSGTSGQGYAGGNGNASGTTPGGGGGGGAGAAGATGGAAIGGTGGVGATSSLINTIGAATNYGQFVSSNYYFAGGGGGSTSNSGSGTALGGYGGGGTGYYDGGPAGGAGTVSTGGGGGAGRAANGGNGGSGIIVIRYAK